MIFDNFLYGVSLMNLKNTDSEYLIEIRASGLKKEMINLNVENGCLYVKSTEPREDVDSYYHHEFWHDRINNKIDLPTDADTDKIDAKLEDGILLIKIPKGEKTKGKIEIK